MEASLILSHMLRLRTHLHLRGEIKSSGTQLPVIYIVQNPGQLLKDTFTRHYATSTS